MTELRKLAQALDAIPGGWELKVGKGTVESHDEDGLYMDEAPAIAVVLRGTYATVEDVEQAIDDLMDEVHSI